MILGRIIVILPLAAALFGAPAWSQSSSPSMMGMSGTKSGSKSPADQAIMAGMTKMNRDMSAAPMTGNPDQDFVAMMIPHHQGAVSMAHVELRYGHNPSFANSRRRSSQPRTRK